MQDPLGGSPSVWACYRFTVKLRENQPALADCLDSVSAALQEARPEYGRNIAIDASDLPAFSNGQRYVYSGGPERERFSDPDASWGHRSSPRAPQERSTGTRFRPLSAPAPIFPSRGASRRPSGTSRCSPLRWLDAARARGFRPETCAMDKGYDHGRVYDECRERECVPPPMPGSA